MAVYYPKSIINNLRIIINIIAFHIILIICENKQNPSELKNNYDQIKLISSGQTLELKISDSLIICNYDAKIILSQRIGDYWELTSCNTAVFNWSI